MIGFHLASRRRANIGLMADDVRSTTQPLPVKIAIMEIWWWARWSKWECQTRGAWWTRGPRMEACDG
ncbi:hypothetical protein V6Z11_A07G050300 [Gossypium hirsutum]